MSTSSTFEPFNAHGAPASIRYVSFNQRDEMAWELLKALAAGDNRLTGPYDIEKAYALVDLFLERAGR